MRALFVLGIVLRLIPHPANFVPIFVISQIFFINYSADSGKAIFFKYPIIRTSIVMLSLIVLSDILLHFLLGYSLNYGWMLANYLSYLMVFMLYRQNKMNLEPRYAYTIQAGVCAPLLYWFSSNAFVWLFSGDYSQDTLGLWYCFSMAIPFLVMSMLANMLCGVMFLSIESPLKTCLLSMRNVES
jgi:hypothetical protein